jgi:hypothetical protein
MPDPLSVTDWLEVIRGEYLGRFIRDGGAAVRFVVVPDDSVRMRFDEDVRRTCASEGYLCARVDSATTRIHLIDRVFNCVATQVDWSMLARAFLVRLLRDAQYKVPDEETSLRLPALAALNGCEERDMRVMLNERLRESLTRDYRLTQEFRFAMTWLCREQIDPGDVPAGLADNVRDWLTGNLRLVSALKQSLIFQKVGRHNARPMLFSLARWLHKCGYSGLVLLLDLHAVLRESRRSSGDYLRYSGAAVLDTYETLRQFVDSTGDLGHSMVIVVVPPSFVDLDERRSVWAYDALRYRVLTEVRDRKVQNPLASQVTLGAPDRRDMATRSREVIGDN